MSVSFITFGFQLRRLNTCFRKSERSGEAKKDVRVKWVSKRERVDRGMWKLLWWKSTNRAGSSEIRVQIGSGAFASINSRDSASIRTPAGLKVRDLKGKTISNRIEGKGERFYGHVASLACLPLS